VTLEFFAGQSLEVLGLPLSRIVRPLSPELPDVTVRNRVADHVFRLADRDLLHLELQTRRAGTRDLERFQHYDVLLRCRYHRPVHTVVLYGRGVRSASRCPAVRVHIRFTTAISDASRPRRSLGRWRRRSGMAGP